MSRPDRTEPENPYAPPEAPLGLGPDVPAGDLAAAEAVRRAHLNHEANVKSVGQLHYLAAVLFGLAAVSSVTSAGFRRPPVEAVVSFVAVAAANLALGYGLATLRPWARWTEAALVGLGLVVSLYTFAFSLFKARAGPGGLLVLFAAAWLLPAAVLWLLVSRKGSVVFSPEYREVIRKTPHVRYRTSCVAVFVLLLLLVLILPTLLILFVRH